MPAFDEVPVSEEIFTKMVRLTPEEMDFIDVQAVKEICKECATPLTDNNRVDIKEFVGLCYTCYRKRPKHICVDLDGVLAQYHGWRGPKYIGPPREGAAQFLKKLKNRGFSVVIHTTRNASLVWEWLIAHDMKHLVSIVTNEKVPALAYIDDRALPFEGDFNKCFKAVVGFVPYWKRDDGSRDEGDDGPGI